MKPLHPQGMTRRAAIGWGLSCAVLPVAALAQSRKRRRVPISARGQDAISRVTGRLQFALSDAGLRLGAPLYLRIIKDQARLEMWVEGKDGAFERLRSYKICGSSSKLGPPRSPKSPRQPEGFYRIGVTDLRPQPVNYLGLRFGWPNAYDVAQGWSGGPSFLQAGCAREPHFGLTDQDCEEVYALVYHALMGGQSAVDVHIFPFAMNGLRMLSLGEGANTKFWRSLGPAWQAFERTRQIPVVRVRGRRYVMAKG
ncbi:MAG: hypothetical protein RL186_845 [Pseudomonadota bacterium]